MKIKILILAAILLLPSVIYAQTVKIPLPVRTKLTAEKTIEDVGLIYNYISSLPQEELIVFYRKTLASLGFVEKEFNRQVNPEDQNKMITFLNEETFDLVVFIFLSSETGINKYALAVQNLKKDSAYRSKRSNRPRRGKVCKSCAKGNQK